MRTPAQAKRTLCLRRSAAAVFCSVVLVGCPASPPGPGLSPSTSSASPKTGPVSLTVDPSPPRQLVPSTFSAAVRPAPPPGAHVKLTLTMPAMAMPPTVIDLKPVGKGVYRGSGAFTMAGDWQALIAVSGRGKPVSEVVPVGVK